MCPWRLVRVWSVAALLFFTAGCMGLASDASGTYRLALAEITLTPDEQPRGICTSMPRMYDLYPETRTLEYWDDRNELNFDKRAPDRLVAVDGQNTRTHCSWTSLKPGPVVQLDPLFPETMRLEWADEEIRLPDGTLLADGETGSVELDVEGHSGTLTVTHLGTWPVSRMVELTY